MTWEEAQAEMAKRGFTIYPRPVETAGQTGAPPPTTPAAPTTPTSIAGYGGYLLPGGSTIDTTLSKRIQELMNPPATFPDVNRQAAELAAARGIPSSAAAYGTGLRMTDEERLRRIALGEQLASSAYSRNLPLAVTPYQTETLNLQKQQQDLQKQWQDFQKWLQSWELAYRYNTPAAIKNQQRGQGAAGYWESTPSYMGSMPTYLPGSYRLGSTF